MVMLAVRAHGTRNYPSPNVLWKTHLTTVGSTAERKVAQFRFVRSFENMHPQNGYRNQKRTKPTTLCG